MGRNSKRGEKYEKEKIKTNGQSKKEMADKLEESASVETQGQTEKLEQNLR